MPHPPVYNSLMAADLVAMFGIDLADRFVAEYGGQVKYIPKDPSHMPISPLLSADDNAVICDYFGGERICVPKTLAPPKTTVPEILRLASVYADTMAPTAMYNTIAKQTHTTTRWVIQVIKRHRDDDTRHPKLF